MRKRGFTLIELLISVGVMTLIVFVIANFAKDIFSLNYSAQASMTVQLEGRKVLNTMVSDLRSMAPSALSAYPLETAGTSTITFYADVNDDSITDRVRYFFDPTTRTLKEGIVLAAGSPPSYNLASENVSTLMSDVANGTSTSVFDYYDKNYAGTSTPLALPVTLSVVQLVKITLQFERDPNRSPALMTVTSQALLRNLKDNL